MLAIYNFHSNCHFLFLYARPESREIQYSGQYIAAQKWGKALFLTLQQIICLTTAIFPLHTELQSQLKKGSKVPVFLSIFWTRVGAVTGITNSSIMRQLKDISVILTQMTLQS